MGAGMGNAGMAGAATAGALPRRKKKTIAAATEVAVAEKLFPAMPCSLLCHNLITIFSVLLNVVNLNVVDSFV